MRPEQSTIHRIQQLVIWCSSKGKAGGTATRAELRASCLMMMLLLLLLLILLLGLGLRGNRNAKGSIVDRVVHAVVVIEATHLDVLHPKVAARVVDQHWYRGRRAR